MDYYCRSIPSSPPSAQQDSPLIPSVLHRSLSQEAYLAAYLNHPALQCTAHSQCILCFIGQITASSLTMPEMMDESVEHLDKMATSVDNSTCPPPNMTVDLKEFHLFGRLPREVCLHMKP